MNDPCASGCFGGGGWASANAKWAAGLNFVELSELELEPFAYRFRNENRWRIDDLAAEMVGLDSCDSDVTEMLAHYRMTSASEPSVTGQNRREGEGGFVDNTTVGLKLELRWGTVTISYDAPQN